MGRYKLTRHRIVPFYNKMFENFLKRVEKEFLHVFQGVIFFYLFLKQESTLDGSQNRFFLLHKSLG